MSDKTWKRIEREVAKRLNGVRLPCDGTPRPDVIQLAGGFVLAEVKHRRRLPRWLHDALIQVEVHAEADQLAVAVLHEKYQTIDDSLVLMRLDDFARWVL